MYAKKNVAYGSVGSTNATSPGVLSSPAACSRISKLPQLRPYTLKVEQQLPTGTTLSVGYIGSHGYHELLSVDSNLPSAPYPYPTQVVTNTSTGLANPNVWNTTNWVSGGQFVQRPRSGR